MSNSVPPHRRQPTRLRHPWDSPGKITGVGCHFLLQCRKVQVKSLSRVLLLVTPWTAAHKAPPSMGFSRQECWSGVPLCVKWASLVVLAVKNPPANAGDLRDVVLIPGLGISPGGGQGNSLQYPCLENPMDRGASWATVDGVTKSGT